MSVRRKIAYEQETDASDFKVMPTAIGAGFGGLEQGKCKVKKEEASQAEGLTGPLLCLFQPGSESEEDALLEVNSEDEKKENAAQAVAKARKRAGVPELALDQLPSTIAMKLVSHGCNSSMATTFSLSGRLLRSCMQKRIKHLEPGLERLNAATQLSVTQTRWVL